MLKSQLVREKGPEVDPLWMGKGMTPDDLKKPQILIDSTYGDSHPGSKHLNQIVEPVKNEIYCTYNKLNKESKLALLISSYSLNLHKSHTL